MKRTQIYQTKVICPHSKMPQINIPSEEIPKDWKNANVAPYKKGENIEQ